MTKTPLLEGPGPYSKMDKEDPEEVFHRRARFLIHKVLEEADAITRRRPSFLRLRLLRLKVTVEKKLSRLRRSLASAVKLGLRKHPLRRLFRGGASAGIPPPIFTLDV